MTFIHSGPNFWPLVYTSALKFSNPLIHPRTYCSDTIFSYLYFWNSPLTMKWQPETCVTIKAKPWSSSCFCLQYCDVPSFGLNSTEIPPDTSTDAAMWNLLDFSVHYSTHTKSKQVRNEISRGLLFIGKQSTRWRCYEAESLLPH